VPLHRRSLPVLLEDLVESIHPNGACREYCWASSLTAPGPERFAAVADAAVEVGANPLITGTARERDLVARCGDEVRAMARILVV
jgi:hypothetical protein